MSLRATAVVPYEQRLIDLLPAFYRARDEQGDLARFLGLFGHELDRLRENIDQLWLDFYVDSCQDWVVPYIADLVGMTVIFNEGARNRADVRNAIKWRRQKGTLVGLEDVAATTTGFGAHAVEMFERLVWSQRLDHRRMHALHTVPLANGTTVARIGTPFETSCRSVDLRAPTQRRGQYQITNVGIFLWEIPSVPWLGATPAKVDARRWRFHPLGLDVQLYAGWDARPETAVDVRSGVDILQPHANHLPIRRRELADHTLSYFGQSCGFSVYEDGILLCKTADAVVSRSQTASAGFEALAPARGITIADGGIFGGLGAFRVSVVGLDRQMSGGNFVDYSPARPFAGNFAISGDVGLLNTSTLAYAAGGAPLPAAPDFQPATLLRIERLGATADFPECELILRGARGEALLVYCPQVAGLTVGQPQHLWVANDGATYFARAAHDAGDPDMNPDAAALGAFLPRHLAREALGQVRPRKGVRPVQFREAVERDLCCWDQPLQRPILPGQVAFDPVRGRFAFRAGEEPEGTLTADFRFAISGELGSGPFARGILPDATVGVAKDGSADFSTVQGAIDGVAPVSGQPTIVEIRDSRTYDETLIVDNRAFPDGLVLRAALAASPVLRSTGGPVLDVTPTTAISKLTIDGLVLAQGALRVRGNVPAFEIRFSTAHPETVALTYAPTGASAALNVANSIVGALTTGANVTSVAISDSVVQHAGATALHPEGVDALVAPCDVTLDRTTVFGGGRVASVRASNCILFGDIAITNADASCLRFTSYRGDIGAASAFRCTTAFPIFDAIRYPHPGYMHVHPNTAASIRSGGEEGGEMGAFYKAGMPWHLQNASFRLDEYLPAGLRPAFVRVLPRLPFARAIIP